MDTLIKISIVDGPLLHEGPLCVPNDVYLMAVGDILHAFIEDAGDFGDLVQLQAWNYAEPYDRPTQANVMATYTKALIEAFMQEMPDSPFGLAGLLLSLGIIKAFGSVHDGEYHCDLAGRSVTTFENMDSEEFSLFTSGVLEGWLVYQSRQDPSTWRPAERRIIGNSQAFIEKTTKETPRHDLPHLETGH